MASELIEVEIEIRDDQYLSPFGPVSSAPRFTNGRMTYPVAPIVLVMPDTVRDALAPGGDDTYGGVIATATPDGMFRIDSADGSWVWELFPARFWDGNGPDVYLAVWGDA